MVITSSYGEFVDDHFSFERNNFFGRLQAASGQLSPEFPLVYPVNRQCTGSDREIRDYSSDSTGSFWMGFL